MALQIIEGFDHYTTAQIALKGNTIYQTSGNYAISSSGGRRGGGAYFVGQYGNELERLVPNAATVITGCAVKATGFSTAALGCLSLLDAGTRQVTVKITSTGQVRVTRGDSSGTVLGTSTNAMVAGAWYYVEMKVAIHPTAGTVEVRVNGDPWLTLTGQNTRSSANSYANAIRIGSDGNTFFSAQSAWYDDWYALDTTGTVNNDFLGDVRVDTILPNADGTYSGFTPSTGTAHYAVVDDPTLDTTDYVATSTNGAKESYQFTDLVVGGQIFGVQIANACYKDDAGVRSAANLIKSGASEVQLNALGLPTSVAFKTSIAETDPATGALWTTAGVNAAEFGMVVTA